MHPWYPFVSNTPDCSAFEMNICDTAAFAAVDGCVVYVGAAKPVSTADWDAYLAFLGLHLTRDRPLPRVVWDDSGGPAPLGRQKLAAMTDGVPVKVALVTDAAAGRNVATVLNWNRQQQSYRAFTSAQLREAIEFAGITGPTIEAVAGVLYELRRGFGLSLPVQRQ